MELGQKFPKNFLIDPYQFSIPPILYHYTSLDGLLGILGNGNIWATNILYLNDASESQQIWNFVLQRLTKRLGTADESTRAQLSRVLSLAEQRRACSDFVASFSEERDSLSQWRAYCPNGSGVSIGFDCRALSSQWVADPVGGAPAFVGHQLSKVRYLPDDSDTTLDDEIDSLLNQSVFRLDAPVEEVFVAWLSVLSARYKHEAFKEEKEWRIVMMKPHKPMPHQRFRPGKSTLIPYIEVELNRALDHTLLPDYFIREIYICPSSQKALSMEAVRNLFTSKGHPEVEVKHSSIPYRNW